MDVKKEISMLSIYELRNIARALGIVRPSLKTRHELIDEITQTIPKKAYKPQPQSKSHRKASPN